MGMARWNRDRPGGAYNPQQMSVFRLIGPDDGLDEASVGVVESAIAAVATKRSTYEDSAVPTDDDLAEALDSPNPGIRSAASRFVAAGTNRLYPKASGKLGR